MAAVSENPEETPWKTVEIGPYLFDVPQSFELIPGQGIDSYIGKLKGNGIIFRFDYGNYSSGMVKSPDEFIRDDRWRYHLMYRSKADTNTLTVPGLLAYRPARITDSLFAEGCDFIATCERDGVLFEAAVFLPEETEAHIFKIDTTAELYTKLTIARKPRAGTTGIYLKKINGPRGWSRNAPALALFTDKLTKKQQCLAVTILKTGRLR